MVATTDSTHLLDLDEFSMTTLLRAFLAGLALLAAVPVGAAEAARPNIVFLMADDLGQGDLGCYNAGSRIPTPHMDELAAKGTRFTDARRRPSAPPSGTGSSPDATAGGRG
jgi:hypothetical protein